MPSLGPSTSPAARVATDLCTEVHLREPSMGDLSNQKLLATSPTRLGSTQDPSARAPCCGTVLKLAVATSALAILLLAGFVGLSGGATHSGLLVTELTSSQVQATYVSDTHRVQATTTNTSMEVLLSPHSYFGSRSTISSEHISIHGYDAAVVKMAGKSFLTILSSYNKQVRTQVPENADELQRHVDPEKLKLMHEEHPSIVSEAVAANEQFAQSSAGAHASAQLALQCIYLKRVVKKSICSCRCVRNRPASNEGLR